MIQIGVKAQYRGAEGQLGIFFGNKNLKGAFHALQADYFVREDDLLKFSYSTLASTLEPGGQTQQRVSCVCVGPYVEAPVLRFSFLLQDNSPRRIQLRLPVTVAKFLEPVDLKDATDFFSIWRDVEYSMNEECAVCDISRKYREMPSLAPFAKACCLGDALKLVPGIDTNPDNLVLSGRWNGETEVQVVLCRVEIGTGAFRGKVRIATRSSSGKLSKAVCGIMSTNIAEAANDVAA